MGNRIRAIKPLDANHALNTIQRTKIIEPLGEG